MVGAFAGPLLIASMFLVNQEARSGLRVRMWTAGDLNRGEKGWNRCLEVWQRKLTKETKFTAQPRSHLRIKNNNTCHCGCVLFPAVFRYLGRYVEEVKHWEFCQMMAEGEGD